LLVLAFSSIIAQALFNASDYWLSIWTNNAKPDKNIGNSTISLLNHGSWQDMIDQNTGTYVYSVLIGSLIVFAFIRSIHFFVICMKSSVKLHDEMFQAVVHAPMSFFDQHPIGMPIDLNKNDNLIVFKNLSSYFRSDTKPVCKRSRLYG